MLKNCLAFAALTVVTGSALAQKPELSASVNDASAVMPMAQLASRTLTYRLNDDTGYLEGCFEPCRCPLSFNDDVRGTFELRRVGQSGTTINYKVDDVNWWVGSGQFEFRVTGSGTYRRVSGVAGWAHEMSLDLSIDGADPVTFSSGLQNTTSAFPDISGLSLSINDFVCFDKVFDLDASLVRPECQQLRDGSSYQEGCLPPCLCPILASTDLRGRYGLVLLQDLGTYQEYAVVDMNLRVVSEFDPPSESFSGVGRYIRISGFAGWDHQMQLDLSIDGEPPVQFDSGLVSGGGDFPAVGITVAQNGFFCYDIVLDIQSRPCRSLGPSLTPLD